MLLKEDDDEDDQQQDEDDESHVVDDDDEHDNDDGLFLFSSFVFKELLFSNIDSVTICRLLLLYNVL